MRMFMCVQTTMEYSPFHYFPVRFRGGIKCCFAKFVQHFFSIFLLWGRADFSVSNILPLSQMLPLLPLHR